MCEIHFVQDRNRKLNFNEDAHSEMKREKPSERLNGMVSCYNHLNFVFPSHSNTHVSRGVLFSAASLVIVKRNYLQVIRIFHEKAQRFKIRFKFKVVPYTPLSLSTNIFYASPHIGNRMHEICTFSIYKLNRAWMNTFMM